MSRNPEIPEEALTPAQRQAVAEIVSGPHGRVGGPSRVWLHSPELARRARALSEFIRFQSSLPAPLRELAILVSARYWSTEYAFHSHGRLAIKAGLDEAVIKAIAENRTPVFTDQAERIVHELCAELYRTHRIGDALFDTAVKVLGHKTVVELVATIGYYSMVSMTLNAFQVGLQPGEKSPFPD